MDYAWNYSDPYEYMRRVSKREMAPLIISVAVTGGSGKEENPNVPESSEEQAQQTYEAYQAGATCVHIHAKDETGALGVADPARFREINGRIRDLCPEIIIGNSTGAGLTVPREEVLNILDAEPEICSLNLGPIPVRKLQKRREPPLRGREEEKLVDLVFPITFGEQESIAKKALEKGVKAELEIHNGAQFGSAQNLIRQGLVQKPYWFQLIFSPRHEQPSLLSFATMANCLPPESMFSVIGLGPYQLPMNTLSIVMGGHVRVGFEDNLYYRKGELAKSNAQFVERIVRIAKELDRDIATPVQAREILGISKIPKQY